MTEYDFAFFEYDQHSILSWRLYEISSLPEGLKKLAEQAGFIVESLEASYYGSDGLCSYFKKPLGRRFEAPRRKKFFCRFFVKGR